MRSARKRSRLRRCASNRGDDPFGDDPLDVFVAGQGAFLDVDGKFFGPAKNFVFRVEKDGLRPERERERKGRVPGGDLDSPGFPSSAVGTDNLRLDSINLADLEGLSSDEPVSALGFDGV
jgi:hypothetical protein